MKTAIEIKIRGYHVDQFHHVNNARFLEFLEEGRWDYLENNHLISVFHSNNINHSVVNIQINYRRSIFTGQTIRVETALLKKSRQSITIQQKLFLKDTDTLITDAEVTNVFVNSKSGKILKIGETLYKLWPELSSLPNN